MGRRPKPGFFGKHDLSTPEGQAVQLEAASKGGKAAHEQGTGHEWNKEQARIAGRKGGQASRGGRGRLPAPDPENLQHVSHLEEQK
jgi:general stress protein YciG